MHTIYGKGDATYQAVGGEKGVRALVDRFYDIMSQRQEYQKIWRWHPRDKQLSRDKLFVFLCGWMGGPARYSETYGPINIPKVHSHLKIGFSERDMWLNCMLDAMHQLSLPKDLIEYLFQQFSVPAERIRQMSDKNF